MSQAEPPDTTSFEHDPGLSLRVIRITGPDAEAFAQAQFTSDVASVAGKGLYPSAWCAADGRARAIVLLGRAEDGMLLLIPDPLHADTLAKLTMFSIGRNVHFDADGTAHPATAPDAVDAMPLAYDPARALIVAPADTDALPLERDWLIRDIDHRMPWLVPATSGKFLPQMLGLERLDGVSYRKGCYPGQEVIARVHYRGRVTKRIARFEVQGGALPGAGSTLSVNDAAGTVLYAAKDRSADRIRGLAVVPSDADETAPVSIDSGSGELVAE